MDYDYGFVPGCVVNIIIPSQKLLALPLLLGHLKTCMANFTC